MRCPYCNRIIMVTTTIRSRIRYNPEIKIIHVCGNEVTVTREEVNNYFKKRLSKISDKWGSV